MPDNFEWQSRIKGVEREYLVIKFAMVQQTKTINDDPSALPRELSPRDYQTASENLEATYLIRLFAEFESGIRQYWKTHKETVPPCKDLISSLAAKRAIPDDEKDRVDLVRIYRNSVVHEREEFTESLSVQIARGYLCTFFSRLPREW
jgi:hypothetical protein